MPDGFNIPRDRGGMRDGRGGMRDGRGGMRGGRGGMRDGRGGMRDGRDEMRDGRGGMRDGRGGMRDVRGGMRDGRGGMRDGRGGMRDGRRQRFPRFFFLPFYYSFPRDRCYWYDRYGRCCDRYGRCCDRYGRCEYYDGYDLYSPMGLMEPVDSWDETPGNWAMLAEMDDRDYDDDE